MLGDLTTWYIGNSLIISQASYGLILKKKIKTSLQIISPYDIQLDMDRMISIIL